MLRQILMSTLSVALVAATAGGCAQRLEAPTNKGVCYNLAFDKDGKARFNAVAENMPNMENCAAQLEGMRLRFARMGSYQSEMAGAYQGTFIFINRQGVFSAKNYEGMRYLALVRTGDGRLAMPGAVPSY